jgi:hypothetical protein
MSCAGLTCIVGGGPLMFCEPVDFAHRCMRWWLREDRTRAPLVRGAPEPAVRGNGRVGVRVGHSFTP